MFVFVLLVCGELNDFDLVVVSVKLWWLFVYLVVIGLLVGFLMFVWLMKYSMLICVFMYVYVNLVVVVFLGWLLFDEEVNGCMVLLVVVIVVGVVLIIW